MTKDEWRKFRGSLNRCIIGVGDEVENDVRVLMDSLNATGNDIEEHAMKTFGQTISLRMVAGRSSVYSCGGAKNVCKHGRKKYPASVTKKHSGRSMSQEYRLQKEFSDL